MEIEDVKPEEKIKKLIEKEKKYEKTYYVFEGGTCERQADGSIRITFGKAEEGKRTPDRVARICE